MNCKGCGESFEPARSNQHYCDDACKQVDRKQTMILKEQRHIALSAARGYLRKMGVNLAEIDPMAFSAALDDLHLLDTKLVASQWYIHASEHQWKLFYREVAQIIREAKSDAFFHSFQESWNTHDRSES